MRYHNITKDDMLNGEGLRVVLWVSGCAHHCEGCHNAVTWDPEGGLAFDAAAEEELFSLLSRDYISGITFSGGDPLYTGNREEIERLARKVKLEYPRFGGGFRKKPSGCIQATAGRKSAHCR